MKPEPAQSDIGLYVLAKLTTNGQGSLVGGGPFGTPYAIMWSNDIYLTLNDAQSAQTYQALKNGIRYEIFHLEFPV